MSDATHTPLPWAVSSLPSAWATEIARGDPRGPIILFPSAAASLSVGERQANAAFVVRACNAHYDLLAACKAMVRTGKAPADIDAAYDLMRAAIAKAEGRA